MVSGIGYAEGKTVLADSTPCNLLLMVVSAAYWDSLLPYRVNLYPHCTPVIQKGVYGTLLAECRNRLFSLVPGAGLEPARAVTPNGF
jgi:hypothetical protein